MNTQQGIALFVGLLLISVFRYALERRARGQWKREFLGRWIDSIQVGATDTVAGVPVYRTLGFGRVRWIVDPFGEDRVECTQVHDAVNAVLRRQA